MEDLKIAVGFFGQIRTFENIYKNINKTFKSSGINFDFFVSTWSEDGKNVENILSSHLEDAIIEVEDLNQKIQDGLELFGSVYPMSYKKNKVFELISKSNTKYDYLILTRLDLEYLEKFPFDSLKKNILFTGIGYFNQETNSINNWWRDKNFKYNDDFKLLMSSEGKFFYRPSDYIFKNICDQIYVGEKLLLEEYLKYFEIMEIYLQKYKNTKSIRKHLEKFFHKLFLRIIKVPRKDKKAKIIFKIYRFFSKNFGFYIPFFCSAPFNIVSKFKPTLYSYIIDTKSISTEELQLNYTIRR